MSDFQLKGQELQDHQAQNLAALQGGLRSWSAHYSDQIAANPQWRPILDDMDLRGISLYDSELSTYGANLQNASMIGITADETTILKNANLNGATIAHSNISGLQAQTASMNEVTFYNNTARNVDFSRAQIDDSNVQGNDMQGANLAGTSYRRTSVVNNDMSHTELGGSEFLFSYVGDNNFSGATGEISDLTNPFPEGSEYHDQYEEKYAAQRSVSDGIVNIDHSKVSGNDFSNANIPRLETGGSIYTNENNFTGANLSKMSSNGTDFTGHDFTGAETGTSFFGGNDLTDVKMTADQIEEMQENGLDQVGQDNLGQAERARRLDNYPIDKIEAKPIPESLQNDSSSPAPEMELAAASIPAAPTGPTGP